MLPFQLKDRSRLLACEASDLPRPLLSEDTNCTQKELFSTEDKGTVDILGVHLERTSASFSNEDLRKKKKQTLRTAASGLKNYSPEPSQWRTQAPASRSCWSL